MIILQTALAQDIVNRTMQIIPFNVNVMDAHGRILASGNPSRQGELHTGALLALSRQLTIEIDAATARNMHGAQPGINLPLRVDGHICGAVGLSGPPDEVRQFGELVRLTAEMILEQAHLTSELQRHSRYREALVLNLIRFDHAASALDDAGSGLETWGQRLGLDFTHAQVAFLLELERNGTESKAESDRALTEIQHLQMRLLSRQPSSLSAAIGSHEMVILKSCDPIGQKKPAQTLAQRHMQTLAALMQEECLRPFRLTMGIARHGIAGVAISYQSARTSSRIGHQRQPDRQLLSYYDLTLPVLLSGLDNGWQAEQLRLPLSRLQEQDKTRNDGKGNENGVLKQTLNTWFAHNGHPAATADALQIHRNTLDYRLRRISEITGLDPGKTEDKLLLYVSSLLTSTT